jgi:hypothetical protein
MKSEESAKFVALMSATVSAPDRAMAQDVPFNRGGIAAVATNTVSTPAPAIKPPMTVNTFCNQLSRPGTAVRTCARVVPMKRASSGNSVGRKTMK